MAKGNRRQSRELRLLQEDSCFEETKNVKRSEFKCNDCSLSFHRKTSYDSHVMINHKKKDEMSEIWNQLEKAEARMKPKHSKPDKVQIVKSNLKTKLVVGLDGKVHKKFKTGIVELRKKVKETNVSDAVKSSNVRLVSPSTLPQKPTLLSTGAAKNTWNNTSVNQTVVFDKKGIQCLICKHYFKNCFEFGVHTTRVEHRIPCQICFQYFENQCHLKRHQRIAHPHVCTMCDKLFSTEQHLDIHQRVSHRMIYQTMKTDNPQLNKVTSIKLSSTTDGSKSLAGSGVPRGGITSSASNKGGTSKSNQLTTIVISDSDSDELTKNSHKTSSQKKMREASGSDLVSLPKKPKLSANDMMQSLATIAKSKDHKDPFSSMLSVMLEKPPIQKAPSIVYTTARPVMSMQVSQNLGKSVLGTTVPSTMKHVQLIQNKDVSLKPTVATTTGLSSFLGQHVTSTVYSNLRPKGSFNLGKQVERVNLACRLAQHKQSLELKRLLKRHPQYKINDKDLKFKIPLGNLNEEFDDCPLFPREEDVKKRTSDYTMSPLSVIDDTDYLVNFGLNTNVMQHMFSEAVDACLLQEAWKLTHSTNLRKRCREVTSYSLKQKQECILDLHVQLLAIRNAAQTIVNKALVKHITELKQVGKQRALMAQVTHNQQSNIQLVGQVVQNELSTQKSVTQSDNRSTIDQNSKDLNSRKNEVSRMGGVEKQSETKQVVTSQADNRPQTLGNVSEAAVECEDKQSGEEAATKKQSKIKSTLNKDVCNEMHGPNIITDQPNAQQLNESAQIIHASTRDVKPLLTDDVTNAKKDLSDQIESETLKAATNLETNAGCNGMKDEIKDAKEVNIDVVSGQKVVENNDIFKSMCNEDANVALIDGDSKPDKNQEQAVKESVVNKKILENQESVIPSEKANNQGKTEIPIGNEPSLVKTATGGKTDVKKCKSDHEAEMEKFDRLQALTEDLVKAIPASRSGETICVSEVQISSKYCGLIGKGHYNGMDFRWIVQFARPYVNTLLTYRNPEWTSGEGNQEGNHNEKLVKSNFVETSHQAVSSTSSVKNSSIETTVSSFASQANIPSASQNMSGTGQLLTSQASKFSVGHITSDFNSNARMFKSDAKLEVPTAPVTPQVKALPSSTGFPLNIVQTLGTAPVGLSQSSVAIPSLSPQSPVAVPRLSPKSSDAAPGIFGQPSTAAALVQMLPVQRPAQPALATFSSIVPACQPISTNILLSQGIQQVQNSAIVNRFPAKVNVMCGPQKQSGINLSNLQNQNSAVCVTTIIGQSRTTEASHITSIPVATVGQKDLRPLLPKVCQPPPGFLTLTSNGVAVLYQDVLLQSTGSNERQLYTLTATNSVAGSCNSLPTTQDSNQLPSEARTFSVPEDIDANSVVEEPKKKFFYRLNDCLEFEAGELVLFNNDIQNGKVPRFQNKKLFRCEVGGDQGCVKETNVNISFLNSLYSIKKLYITGHLSKTVYQKLIPIAQILTCPRIPLHGKRTFTFLVELSLKQAHRNSAEDVNRIHNTLLDVLKKGVKKPKEITGDVSTRLVKDKESKSGIGAAPDTKSSEFKVITSREGNAATECNRAAEIKECVLQVCLTDLKLPRNQSTVFVTEKKNAKNEHTGFMIKSKTGALLKRNTGVLTREDSTRMRARAGNGQELTKTIDYDNSNEKVVAVEIGNTEGSKVKTRNENTTMNTIKETRQTKNMSNDSRQLRMRKHPIRMEARQKGKQNGCRKEKASNEPLLKLADSFVIPDETDPEIEFASPSSKRKKKSEQKK